MCSRVPTGIVTTRYRPDHPDILIIMAILMTRWMLAFILITLNSTYHLMCIPIGALGPLCMHM